MLSIVLGIASVVTHSIIYLAVIRIPLKIGFLTRQLLLGCGVYLVSLQLCSIAVEGLSFWRFSASYYFGSVAYFFLTSGLYTSISARILWMLSESDEMILSASTIINACVVAPFVERADQMTQNGLAAQKNGLYFITPAGKQLVNRILWLRKLFGVNTTGFYS